MGYSVGVVADIETFSTSRRGLRALLPMLLALVCACGATSTVTCPPEVERP